MCTGAAGGPAPSLGEGHLGVVHRAALRKAPSQNCIIWGDDCFLWGLAAPHSILLVTLPLNSSVGPVWAAPMYLFGGPWLEVGLGSSSSPPPNLFQPQALVQ